MTTTDVVLAGFPFVVEPVNTERVQSWAAFASQTSTKEAFHVVSTAFGALWMEDIAAYEFRQAAQYVYEGGLHLVVMWLDGVVSSLQHALDRWQQVLEQIGCDPQIQVWATLWSADASARVEVLSRLLSQVVDWIVWCCTQAQWDLTSDVLPETRKYLASRR